MPSAIRIQSDIVALVRSLPTVKDAMQAKQGLRALRDEVLYRQSSKNLQLSDTAKMEELGISDLLIAWFNTAAGEPIIKDIKQNAADEILQEFDEALKQIDLIQLNLAYVAPTEDLVRYHRWFSQVIGRPVMLDVRLDRQLLAGASFVYNDHLYDFSLKQKMPEIEAKLLDNFKNQNTAVKPA